MQLEIGQLERRYAAVRIADAARQRELVASLVSHGQQQPVQVVQAQVSERYVLIDGYRRVAALEALSRDVVEVVVLALSELQALVLAYGLDRSARKTAIEEGWLLETLIEQHEVDRHALATMLGRSRSWVSRRLALVEVLPDVVHDAVRCGQLCAQGAMKALVPLARANTAHCVKLVEALGGRPISARQLQRVVSAWRRGDAEQKERIAAHPLLFAQATEPEAGQSSAVTLLFADFRLLRAVGQRCERRLAEHALHHADRPTRFRLRRSYQAASACVAALEPYLHEDVDDRPRDTHSDLAPAS
jgi:ParB family chromosome partitioning protein